MFRLGRNRPVRLCSVLLLVFPIAAISQAKGLAPEFLADLRLAVRLHSSSGLDSIRQENVLRGARLGMRLWQSILPDLRVHWVAEGDRPDLVFAFGDYRRPRQPACKMEADWTACSSFPGSDGRPQRDTIYFNTLGKGAFHLDSITFVSRDSILQSYEPATYPPVYYRGDSAADPQTKNPGFISGRFRAHAHGEDVAIMVFHEFGHSLGLRHIPISRDGFLAWYGHPGHRQTSQSDPGTRAEPVKPDANGATPVEPPKIQPKPHYPDLKPYYGGGSPDRPWKGDLRQEHMPRSLMTGGSTPPLGIPLMPYAAFNARLVFELDAKAASPFYRVEFPWSRGLIRMEKPGSEGQIVETRLTRNWLQALEWSGWGEAFVDDPFYVADVLIP